MKFTQSFAYTSSLALALILLSGCAGKSINDCPSESAEHVSVCRAEVACGKGKFSTSMGMILSGIGSGVNHTSNSAADRYNRCIDDNMDAQRANAGIASNVVKCETTSSGGVAYTKCHQ